MSNTTVNIATTNTGTMNAATMQLLSDVVRSRRALLAGISLALLLTSIGYLALYPTLDDQLRQFTDDMPDVYRAFIGDADLSAPSGYIRSQVYSMVAPLLVAGLAIGVATGLARSERDRTLTMMVLTPLSRRRIALAWTGAVGTMVTIAGCAMFGGVVVGAPLAGATVGIGRIVLATAPVLLFAMFVGAVALLASSLTGAPGVATAAGWTAVLVSFLANSLAELLHAVSWLTWVSPWSWHGSGEALTGTMDLVGFGLLVAATALVGSAAVGVFARRNLHL